MAEEYPPIVPHESRNCVQNRLLVNLRIKITLPLISFTETLKFLMRRENHSLIRSVHDNALQKGFLDDNLSDYVNVQQLPKLSKRHHKYLFHDQFHPSETKLLSERLFKILAVSVISTIKVDSPFERLSLAPTRVNTLSTIPILASRSRNKTANLSHQNYQSSLS